MRTPAVGVTPSSSAAAQQHVDLAQLLDDDEHLVAELLAHEGEAHELLVLVAVADDEVLGALGQPEHRLQLGLGAALEADAVLAAELDDLLDDVPLLVDLDRVHGGVAAGVLELADRAARTARSAPRCASGGCRRSAAARAARRPAPRGRSRGRAGRACARSIRVRAHDDVARLVDVEEARAPALDVVERLRVINRPLRRSWCRWRRRGWGL